MQNLSATESPLNVSGSTSQGQEQQQPKPMNSDCNNKSLPSVGLHLHTDTDTDSGVVSDTVAEIPADKKKNNNNDVCIAPIWPKCWTAEQQDYFLKIYPWLFGNNGKIGCNVCKEV